MFSYLANPHRFMKLSRWLAPICFGLAALLVSWSVWQALYVISPETYQGDSARIMFIHVPSAWLAMSSYIGLAVASFVWFIWRHELADIAAKAIAPIGAIYTALCLATGSLWGKPAWGTWFQWEDSRMVSVLVLFFLFLGYMALRAAMDTRQKAARAGAILAMVGIINVPLIKFSVDAFASVHQTSSIFAEGGPAMPAEYLVPLLIGALGHTFLFAALVMTAMRTEIYSRKADTIRMQRLAGA